MAGANMTVNELEYAVAMEDLVGQYGIIIVFYVIIDCFNAITIETETFNRELKNQTIELQNEVEELTLQLVDRRRNLPLQVSKLVGHAFQLEQELLENKVTALVEPLSSSSIEEDEKIQEKGMKIKYYQ